MKKASLYLGVLTSNCELFRGRERKVEVPLARAPPASPRSRAPPPPRSPLRVPPGSPRSDLPPLTRLLPPSASSRPKLFFLISKVPHWLAADILRFPSSQTYFSFLSYLPILLFHQFIAFYGIMYFHSTWHLFPTSSHCPPHLNHCFKILVFVFTLFSLFCHLFTFHVSFFTVDAITLFGLQLLKMSRRGTLLLTFRLLTASLEQHP